MTIPFLTTRSCGIISSSVAVPPRRASSFPSDRLGAAPDDRQHRGAVLRRHGVNAAVRPVVHVARGHGARFIGVGPLDDEDQLVADVAVRGQGGPGLEARQYGAPLARLVLP